MNKRYLLISSLIFISTQVAAMSDEECAARGIPISTCRVMQMTQGATQDTAKCVKGDCTDLERRNQTMEKFAPFIQGEIMRGEISNSIRQQDLGIQYRNYASQLKNQAWNYDNAAKQAEQYGRRDEAAQYRREAERLREQAADYDD